MEIKSAHYLNALPESIVVEAAARARKLLRMIDRTLGKLLAERAGLLRTARNILRHLGKEV